MRFPHRARALRSGFVRGGSLQLSDLGPIPVFGLISIIATAEKDRAKKDASLSRVNSGGRGRQSTYADTRRCGARNMGRQRQIP